MLITGTGEEDRRWFVRNQRYMAVIEGGARVFRHARLAVPWMKMSSIGMAALAEVANYGT